MPSGRAARPDAAASPESGSPASRRVTPRRTVVLSLLLLAGLSVLSAVPTWLTTTASTALDPHVEVTVSGTTAAPGVSAAALVVLAAALSLGLVGRVARWASLAVVALGGAVVGGSALSFVLSPDAAARSGVAEATGVARPATDVDVSAAPYVTVVLGAAVLAVAVWAAFAPVDWGRRTNRYDAPHAPHAASPSAGERSATQGADGAVPVAGAPAGRPVVDRSAGEPDEPLDERDAWDSLTQGDDPT